MKTYLPISGYCRADLREAVPHLHDACAVAGGQVGHARIDQAADGGLVVERPRGGQRLQLFVHHEHLDAEEQRRDGRAVVAAHIQHRTAPVSQRLRDAAELLERHLVEVAQRGVDGDMRPLDLGRVGLATLRREDVAVEPVFGEVAPRLEDGVFLLRVNTFFQVIKAAFEGIVQSVGSSGRKDRNIKADCLVFDNYRAPAEFAACAILRYISSVFCDAG